MSDMRLIGETVDYRFAFGDQADLRAQNADRVLVLETTRRGASAAVGTDTNA